MNYMQVIRGLCRINPEAFKFAEKKDSILFVYVLIIETY
jgi:hypothetical protein